MVYELTLVIPGSASPQKKKAATDTIEKLIKVNKGEIESVLDMGRIELSYPMKKNDSGQFFRYDVSLEPEGAKAITNRLRAEDEFIRYLLVKKNVVSLKKSEKEQKTRNEVS